MPKSKNIKHPIIANNASTKTKKGHEPFVTIDREAAFKHFAPLVASTPESELEPWSWDAEIVRTNAARCFEAIEPHLEAMASKMPHVDVDEIREMPSLALAVAFADARVFTPASSQEIRARQRRQRPMRKLALLQLQALAGMGLLDDPSKVDAILVGRGAVDEARDGVAAVAVFNENAGAIAGKHPFDAAWLAQLAADSNWLLDALRVRGAKADPPGKHPDALARDQLYTELVRRYGQGKKIAVEVWGWRVADAHYPSLLAREPSSRAKDTSGDASAPAGGAPAGSAPAGSAPAGSAPVATAPEPPKVA